MKRVIVVVMDSVGIGELPDAASYGDIGSNTLGNISKAISGFNLPNLEALGLGNIQGAVGLKPAKYPRACFGKMAEASPGKDTTTGHWEIAGLILKEAFPVFPNGFPVEIIDKFEKIIGTKILGNIVASGTEIIMKLGDQHVRTGYPIVYTSADSVFQIAAHEGVISLSGLYDMCRAARSILTGKYSVGRVIARPFEGTKGNYIRTQNRHDFAINPYAPTILDHIKNSGLQVCAVGKINDIFNGCGVTESTPTKSNEEGIIRTIELMYKSFSGLIFTNLVDFDMLYGHRNNTEGYAKSLIEFDKHIPELLKALKGNDLLIITADHGCDPTTGSTDHSREYVPLLVYGEGIKSGIDLGIRSTFADIAATVKAYLAVDGYVDGSSFYDNIRM